jgi:ACS family tartrate transporter-like MFS transporter
MAGEDALRKASWRLLPFLGLCYGVSYIDRVNISFAALQMNRDLHFSGAVYGLGAGLFFLSYAALEVPSNILLVRFGARRWIARIMLTWGALATGMMFVKTPGQFYVMRFALGAAEAGFFPGVIFYLMQWFPAEFRGRAISRFYLAFPLSSAVMGALAGVLLGLQGRLDLAGWQWLFLIEGLPAIVLGVVMWIWLPDTPARVAWLTPPERDWMAHRLAADRARLGETSDHETSERSVWRVLAIPVVWRLGLCNFCIMGMNYAFSLSAPALLVQRTGWTAQRVGFMMSAVALAGAVTMVLNGWHSDRSGERHLHVAIPLALWAAAVISLGLSHVPLIAVSAYGVMFLSSCAIQAAFWTIPSDALHGRSAAIGVAAIGCIGMAGAFVGPYAWGLATDFTGDYRASLLALALPALMAAAGVLTARSDGGTSRFLTGRRRHYSAAR